MLYRSNDQSIHGRFLVIKILKRLSIRIKNVVRIHQEHRVNRGAFMNTVYLNDKILEDIGVTREEVDWAASLPLSENASQKLFLRAQKRRYFRQMHL